MSRVKGLWPLAIVGAVLVWFWVELCFDWVGPNLTGQVPQLMPVVAAGFVSWGFYFAAGTGTPALIKVIVGSIFGVIAAYLLMAVGPNLMGGKVMGVSITAGILALILLFCIAIGDMVYVPMAFGAFASTVFVWQITGLANFLPAAPTQMSIANVTINTLIALVAGGILGFIHSSLAAVITPGAQKADEAAAVEAVVDR